MQGNHRRRGWSGILLVLGALWIACAGAQKPLPVDARALIREGRFAEARQALMDQEKAKPTAEGQALIAITLVAEMPNPQGRDLAEGVLSEAIGLGTSGDVFFKLVDEASLQSEVIEINRASFLVEAALAAVGLRSGKPARVDERFDVPTRQVIGAKLLSLLSDAIERHKGTIPLQRIYVLWGTSVGLLMEGADRLGFGDRHQFAYDTYLSQSRLSTLLGLSNPATPQVAEMLEATVLLIESNPAIRVSVECDLRSPIDALRKVLAYDRPRLLRLENVLSEAKGCTRGTYDPP